MATKSSKEESLGKVGAMASTNSLRLSINSHKGHFNRERRFLQDLASGDYPDRTRMDKIVDSLQARIEKVADIVGEIAILEPAAEDEYRPLLDELMGFLGETGRQASLAGRELPTHIPILDRPPNFRPASDLKPSMLSQEATPPEMREWISKFKAFHTASNMSVLGLEEEKEYLLSRIEGALAITLRGSFRSATSLADCFELIEVRFLEIHPLFRRRLQWFEQKKKRGQKLLDFYHKLRGIGDEAELEMLNVDDLHMFQTIYACRDEPDLFFKLLEVQNPKLADILAIGTAFESAKDTQQVASPRAFVDAVRKVNCGECGSTVHQSSQCPRGKMRCFDCHKVGHTTRFCRERRQRSRPHNFNYSHTPERDLGAPRQPNATPNRYRSYSPARISAVTFKEDAPTINLMCKFPRGPSFHLLAVADSGASRSVLPTSALPQGITPYPSRVRLMAANGTILNNTGSISFTANAPKGPSVPIRAIVSSDLSGPALISWHDLVALDILPEAFPSVISRGIAESEIIGTLDCEEDWGDDSNNEDEHFFDCVEEINFVCDDSVFEDCLSITISDDLDQIRADYCDVLVTSLGDASGCIKGPKMKIELDTNVNIKPCQVTTARPVPIHYRDKSDSLMTELISAKALRRVTWPTNWCSPAHFVGKPGGKKVRLVTDYRVLNKAVKRPVHPFSSVPDLIRQIRPTSRWFAKVDAVHGYFQVPLDDESADLTTFLLPSGRFQYLVAPMGLNSSSDEFNIRTDAAVHGLPWLLKIVDDMLIQAPTRDLLFSRLRIVLGRCRIAGIKLSLEKLEVGQSVKFAGFLATSEGVKPDPSKIASIKNFPRPDLAHSTVHLRELLKKSNAFMWLDVHENEFAFTKALLCSSDVVHPFNPELPTELLTDASRLHGLGYALIQRDENSRPRLIQCGSCSLTPAQKNFVAVLRFL